MTSGESDLIFLILTHMEEDGCTFWAQRHSPTIKMDLEHVTNRLEKIAKAKKSSSNDHLENKVYGSQFLDEMWYRCRVLFPMPKSKCLVQYIDYGNCQEKDRSSLVDVPIDMQESSIPAMAYRYHLFDISIKPENIDNAREYIQSRCCDDFVKAKMISSHDASPTEVVLYDEDGMSICKQLIEAGLAATAASVKENRSIVVSPPPVPQAQLFKNPLLSSNSGTKADARHDWGNNFQKFSRKKNVTVRNCDSDEVQNGLGSDASDNLENSNTVRMKNSPRCQNCQEYKESAERMRLLMIKLQHDLSDLKGCNAELMEKVQYWKKKFMEVQEKKIRSEASEDGIMNRKTLNASPTRGACGDFIGGGSLVTDVTENLKQMDGVEAGFYDEMDAVKKMQLEKESPMKQKDQDESKMTREVGALKMRQEDNACIRMQQEEDAVRKHQVAFEKSSTIMRNLVMPALQLAKKLAISNKIVDDYLESEKEMQDVVAKISKHIENGIDQNNRDFFALVSRRNAIFENLKQAVLAAVTVVSGAHDAARKDQVDCYLAQLKCLIQDGKGEVIEKIEASDVVQAIEAWNTAKENRGDLSGIAVRLISCLTQHAKKYYTVKDLAEDIRTLKGHISAFESQEKVIKDMADTIKNIRKKKQKIRLLVAELRNLKEDEYVEPTEREEISFHMEKIEKDLALQRRELQESFESKWILMESLADMVEKFSPELKTEHPEFGIGDYLKGKGIVIKDMELDHFNVNRIEQNGSTELLYSEYRGEKMVLHKCSTHSATDQCWENALHKIAIYTNIACPTIVAPIGIFMEKGSAYVMVTMPQHEASMLSNDISGNIQDVQVILKDIATALSSLHENGITHGELTRKSVLIAEQPKLHAYLDVPNFFAQLAAQESESGENTLAKDIKLFGTMAKNLFRNADHPKMQTMIDNCLKNYSSITMQNVLEAF